MDLGDHRGFGEHQEIVVPLERLRKILKALTPVIFFREFVLLDHGAHGPVQNQHALSEFFKNGMSHRLAPSKPLEY